MKLSALFENEERVTPSDEEMKKHNDAIDHIKKNHKPGKDYATALTTHPDIIKKKADTQTHMFLPSSNKIIKTSDFSKHLDKAFGRK
jgi:hypothetical protein